MANFKGALMGFRDGSYNSKTGKHVSLLVLDIYDETLGPVSCQMANGSDVVLPPLRTDVIVDVIGYRKLNFGPGVQFTVANLRPLNGSSSLSQQSPPPPQQVKK